MMTSTLVIETSVNVTKVTVPLLKTMIIKIHFQVETLSRNKFVFAATVSICHSLSENSIRPHILYVYFFFHLQLSLFIVMHSLFTDIANALRCSLRSNSDQRQISLCNINAFSVREVTRIKDIITQHEFRSWIKKFSTFLL